MLGASKSASKPAKAPRKSVRSTSPRAVELRRLQNRLSQRNHRSRLRQARENTQGDPGTVLKPQTAATDNPPDSPQHALVDTDASSAETVDLMVAQSPALAADTMIMAEDLLQYDTPWHHIDSMMNIRASSENDSRASQSSFTPPTLSPPNTSSANCTCNNIAGPCSSHVEKMRAQILAETNDLHIPNVSIADDITPRFGIVLEAIRQAGFQDMEEMVLAYYTSRFEWGSFPAMVQSVSRKRRLKAMLQELQKRSGQWSRWESRGLHESVSEAAVSLCVDEMERLTKSLPVLLHPSHNETANLVSALEWLLRDQGCGVQSYMRPGDEEKLEGLVENAPDSMPHLWSLLTELTGAQGLYCDRIARVVLAVILHARRAQ